MLKKYSKGFTLIELLVVIGILGILLAIVLVALNPARQFAQANNTKRNSDVVALLNAIHEYAADNKGDLPGGITTADQEISGAAANLCSSLVPTYLAALPVDPQVVAVAGQSEGQQVSSPCPGTYVTGYHVIEDSAGRVTVSATPQSYTGGPTTIEVTR